jgi:hypothetical protein
MPTDRSHAASRRKSVSYSLDTRRKGGKWTFSCTPDSTNAEKRVQEWAEANPGFEYRLTKTTTVEEVFVVAA